MIDDWPAFGVRVRTLGGTTVVEIWGELDLYAASRISVRIDTLVPAEVSDLVLDLRPVTFMDCAGLSLLCRLRNRALARGSRLRLVMDSPRLLRLLRMVRLEGVFEILPDLRPVEAAWAARPPAGPDRAAADRPGAGAAAAGVPDLVPDAPAEMPGEMTEEAIG
ncbi:STAS domain-containing protein [Streptomyces sp. B1866]|uniref:STAS domain-containing protein n=1 Tax=Streptomyces sp. B1866 TaxID=3075431 RepID=UPI00288F8C6D|nr:STAS domain-containing protein [Streptomyces sp. B1866]MDT3397979.1 STAS domain-containing protein [Streptomyces sp. B1866]